MKKLLSILVIASVLFTGCANSIPDGSGGCNQGKRIESYGFFTQDEKLPNVKYKICVPDVVVSCIFCETLLIPILVLGFDMYEPQYIIDETIKCK
jgi:hypothetical protein